MYAGFPLFLPPSPLSLFFSFPPSLLQVAVIRQSFHDVASEAAKIFPTFDTKGLATKFKLLTKAKVDEGEKDAGKIKDGPMSSTKPKNSWGVAHKSLWCVPPYLRYASLTAVSARTFRHMRRLPPQSRPGYLSPMARSCCQVAPARMSRWWSLTSLNLVTVRAPGIPTSFLWPHFL